MERFSIDTPEFNTNTYWGRFESIRVTINPLFFFNSDSHLRALKAKVDAQKAREQEMLARTGDKHVLLSREEILELRDAQHQTACSFSPDTGEMIFHSGRFSNFIFYNLPIAAIFVLAGPTPMNTVFSQWLN